MDYLLSQRQNIEKSYHNKKYRQNQNVYDIYAANKSYYKHFYSLVNNISGKKVLDYGCGDGWFSFEMGKKSAEIWGIDISDELIKRAIAKKNNSNIFVQFMVMPCEKLCFQDNFFDIIVGSAILHHIDIEIALKEIKRVLKISGHAYFIEPMNENLILKIWRLITPWRRSPTEKALVWGDILLIKRIFPKSKFRFFLLLSIFTSGLMLFFPKNYLLFRICNSLEHIEQIIINKFPKLGKYCAVTVMEIEK